MIVTRFAPSPTGRLHLGHAFAARFARDAAVQAGGRFLLRIEDIDPTRCKAEYIDGIYEDLEWLGLTWDGTPRLQSEHMDEYMDVLNRLKDQGVLYPCVCTRGDIKTELARIGHAPHAGETAVYPGTCRGLHHDVSYHSNNACRLDSGRVADSYPHLSFYDAEEGETVVDPQLLGDVVLARKETPASYHLCSVWDDSIQGVTLVTRGKDLISATHVHRLLQAALGLDTVNYHHHSLVLDDKGERLAKRKNVPTIKDFRDKGYTPEEIFKFF